MISKIDVLKEKILSDIRSGKLKPGEALPSRHQFMRKYGCARGSIDVAIADLSRDGYVFSRQGSGTFVARDFPTAAVSQVFIVDSFKSPVILGDNGRSGRLAAGIQPEVPCYLYNRSEININLNKVIRPGNSVIWVCPSYDQLMVINYIANAGIPQLLIGRTFGDYQYITTDSSAGIKSGLEWLIEKAGKDIVYIAKENNPDFPYIAERHIDFFRSAAELGIQLHPESLHFLPDRNPGREIGELAEELFSGDSCPKAIFLSHIGVAFTFISLAEAKGKVPGKDFHILLFDQDLNLLNRDGIAMLRQRWEAMDEGALKWVLNLRDGGKDELYKRIKPELVINGEK